MYEVFIRHTSYGDIAFKSHCREVLIRVMLEFDKANKKKYNNVFPVSAIRSNRYDSEGSVARNLGTLGIRNFIINNFKCQEDICENFVEIKFYNPYVTSLHPYEISAFLHYIFGPPQKSLYICNNETDIFTRIFILLIHDHYFPSYKIIGKTVEKLHGIYQSFSLDNDLVGLHINGPSSLTKYLLMENPTIRNHTRKILKDLEIDDDTYENLAKTVWAKMFKFDKKNKRLSLIRKSKF